MKTWVEMTERERDVLVCQTLGYIPAKLNWWMNPNKDFNCDPTEAQEWVHEGTGRYAGYGVEYEGGDERFKRKKFLTPCITSRFSTDRAAAMTLLDGEDVELWTMAKTTSGGFAVTIRPKIGYTDGATGESLSDTICRAFLRAKGINIE